MVLYTTAHGEPAVSYRRTGCVWEISGWSWRPRGGLPIILEESIEYTSNEWKHQNRKMSTCNQPVGSRITRTLTDYAQKLPGHCSNPQTSSSTILLCYGRNPREGFSMIWRVGPPQVTNDAWPNMLGRQHCVASTRCLVWDLFSKFSEATQGQRKIKGQSSECDLRVELCGVKV